MDDEAKAMNGSSKSNRSPADAGVVLRSAMTPATRTVGYYARSWRRYLRGDNPGDLPVARPTMSLAREAFRDEIVLGVFRMLRPGAQPEVLDRVEREVAQALELYQRSGWCGDPRGFFTTPLPLHEVDVEHVGGRRPHERISFNSEYRPHPGEPGGERWSSYTANRREYAWMLRHPEPRPWLVDVHGAGMGSRATLDMALFRARDIHRRLGLNVILPVLPLHGPRRAGLDREVGFATQDMLDNVHGAAQAVWDIRRLISWIRFEDGEDISIGLNSISLGGYITALVASLERDLTCAILGVPVADLVDLVDRHAGPAPTSQQWRAVDLARQLGAVVSPLNLSPQVPLRGRFIYAGLADRVVHPRYQVARLWEHWDRPQIEWYQGGHSGFFRSRPVQDFIENALRHSGLVP